MPMYLKVLHSAETPEPARQPHSIYGDLVSCNFRHFKTLEEMHAGDGTFAFGEAKLWVRDPVKTAIVPGFVEHECNVILGGPSFLMNEQGRTFDTFLPTLEQIELFDAYEHGGWEEAEASQAKIRQQREENTPTRDLTSRQQLYVKHRLNGLMPSKAATAAGYLPGIDPMSALETNPAIVAALERGVDASAAARAADDRALLAQLTPDMIAALRRVCQETSERGHGTIRHRADAAMILQALDRPTERAAA